MVVFDRDFIEQLSNQPPLALTESIIMSPDSMNKNNVLPSINDKQEERQKQKKKVSKIALGLPEVPRSESKVKPFNYKQKDQDFTLG